MPDRPTLVSYAVGLVGAVVGGAVGFFVRSWLLPIGLDALILPGALVGLGCGLISRRRSWLLAALCGVGGLALGILSEWHCCPFVADDRLVFFLQNLGDVRLPAKIMIVLGALLAFWLGLGRDEHGR